MVGIMGFLDAWTKRHGCTSTNSMSIVVQVPFTTNTLIQTPVYTLLETPCSPDFRSRLFLTDDPALIVLYGQLRHKSLQTLRGASKVNPRIEWEFVLHSAKLYDRMGCDLLGLDLGRKHYEEF